MCAIVSMAVDATTVQTPTASDNCVNKIGVQSLRGIE